MKTIIILSYLAMYLTSLYACFLYARGKVRYGEINAYIVATFGLCSFGGILITTVAYSFSMEDGKIWLGIFSDLSKLHVFGGVVLTCPIFGAVVLMTMGLRQEIEIGKLRNREAKKVT